MPPGWPPWRWRRWCWGRSGPCGVQQQGRDQRRKPRRLIPLQSGGECIARAKTLMQAVLTVGIPAALLAAGASVLLMRSLRHEAQVYLQPAEESA